jgi:hypothetical protein
VGPSDSLSQKEKKNQNQNRNNWEGGRKGGICAWDVAEAATTRSSPAMHIRVSGFPPFLPPSQFFLVLVLLLFLLPVEHGPIGT